MTSVDDLLQEHLPARRALGHHPRDLVIPLGVQRREGQVLELPLHGVHAQPVRQRREDLQHLARLALLLLARQVAQGAHVVQPVGQLDDQDPDVARHGDDHLAHGLGGGGLAVLDLVQLGHPVDQRRHVVAELAAQFRQRVGGVLDRVVQQRRADGLVVHAQLGQDRGHRERVGDVGVAAQALLAGVPAGGHLVRALDEPDVGLGVGRPHRLGQGLEHRVHSPAAWRAEARQPPPDRGAADGPGRRVGGGAVGTARAAGPAEASGTAAGTGSAGTGSAEAGSAEAGSAELAGGGLAGAGSAGADSAGPGSAETGTAVSRAASPLSPGAAGKSCCPGAEEATSAPALPVIATSPATCAPVIRQEPILSAASRPHVLLSSCGHRRGARQHPRMPQRFCGKTRPAR